MHPPARAVPLDGGDALPHRQSRIGRQGFGHLIEKHLDAAAAGIIESSLVGVAFLKFAPRAADDILGGRFRNALHHL